MAIHDPGEIDGYNKDRVYQQCNQNAKVALVGTTGLPAPASKSSTKAKFTKRWENFIEHYDCLQCTSEPIRFLNF